MHRGKAMKIKVCGITNNKDIAEISALKPDYLGFIFYPPSPRDVTNRIASLDLSVIPKKTSKVAVFVNESYDSISKIIDRYGFEFVQLHGDESPEFCNKLQRISKIIKAFRIADTLPKNLNEYQDTCDYLLFDSAGKNYGGNGIGFNHLLINEYNGKLPFFLSGGISVDDSSNVKTITHKNLHAVDINSKFEIEPGIKDMEKLKAFFNNMISR
ncbi:MAG: phosphoribosylanthranilate isomerase [Bacteroidales bacterium]|nr:MAG: phosphoribosylanthranilate isomerase [Bacteroidales bacterium]